MVEKYSSMPELDLETLRKERPSRAKVQKSGHSLRREIANLGYLIQAETTIETREYYILSLPVTLAEFRSPVR